MSAERKFYEAAKVEFLDVGTGKLPWRTYGKGEPVLLVHGWPFSGFVWRKILPALADRYRCIVVDLLGAGDSDWTDTNDFSFHGHAAHLQKLVRHLGIDSYRLLAHDTGATVARRLAVLEGERVKQGIYIDTEIPNHRPPLVPLFQKVLGMPVAPSIFRWLLRSDAFVRSNFGFGSSFFDKSFIVGEFHDAFIAPLRTNQRRFEGQIRYVLGIHWQQLDKLAVDHAKIHGSTLLLWGENDYFFPLERAQEMAKQFRKCDFVSIPQCGLLPHEEKPDVVIENALGFFGATNEATARAASI